VTWAPDYVDAAALADFVRVNLDNPYVGTYGTAAARAVDSFCNRQFGKLDAPGTFVYESHNAFRLDSGRWLLEVDDISDLSGLVVTVDGATVAAGVDGYQLWERNALAQGYVHTALSLRDRPSGDVEVTDAFGWPDIPGGVTGAVWLQVNRWNIRRESPYGTAGTPGDGSDVKLGAVLDPDVRTMLSGGRLVRARMPR
jgi:hypothetical protein